MCTLWLGSLYETLTAGRKIQLEKVFFGFYCPVCMPVDVSSLNQKKYTVVLAVSSPAFDVCLLKPPFCDPERPTLATVPSPVTSVSCCMLMRPATILSYTGICCTYRWSRGSTSIILHCHWQMFTPHAFKGFYSFFSNQKADLTLIWRDMCLSSVLLSGLMFIKNQGTIRVKLWQIVWSFYYHVQFSNFHNLDLNETVLLLSACKMDVAFSS